MSTEELQTGIDDPNDIHDESIEEVEDQETQSEDSEGAESAPAEGQKVQFTPEQQAVLDKAIGDKVRKYREAEREKQQLQQELEKLRQMLPQEKRPDVPPMPDPYDDDYAAKVAKRDDAIRKAAEWDARQQAVEWQRQQTEQAKQRAELQQRQETVEVYAKRAQSFGIKPEELAMAGQAVAAYGVDMDLASFIVEHDKGPLITTYLARNPLEVEKLTNMSKLHAASYIASVIAPKVDVVRGRSNAPKPPETLGSGGAPRAERGPKGATFE